MAMRTSAQDAYLEFSPSETLTINYSYVSNLLLIGFISMVFLRKLHTYCFFLREMPENIFLAC